LPEVEYLFKLFFQTPHKAERKMTISIGI